MEKKLDKKLVYGILIVICLFLIFFVGKSFNTEKGKTQTILTTHGVQHFRKGLDVSGGTKLVYKIGYDKYEEVYEGAELENIKRTIQQIILKNIDNRVSGLGVSDYKTKIETMDSIPYITVELGGINDLDQAKEIIGKTVELEFRLPNNAEATAETIAERKILANNLRQDIINANGDMEKIASTRGSEDISYYHLTGVTLSELPEIISKNPQLLENNKGEISDILDGLFYTASYQDLSGNIKQEELNGFTFFRLNDKKEVSVENATVEDVINVLGGMGKQYSTRYAKESSQKEGKYGFENGNLVYNIGKATQDDTELYDVKVIQVKTETAEIGADEEHKKEIEKNNEEKIKNVKESMTLDSLNLEYATLIGNSWTDIDSIKNIIPSFDEGKIGEIQEYSNLGNSYVVYLRDKKTGNENLYQELIASDINEDKFTEALKSKILYDVEIVFVKDKISRITAKTSKGDILNGAYFKYATVAQGQMGEPVVAINFDDKGKDVFCDITSENIGTEMAIFIGGDLLTSPVIQAKICGGTAQIDGGFTSEKAKEYVDKLNDGALPATLILMQEDKVSPTLGATALQGALIAALIGTLLIFGYIRFLYGRKKGLITLIILLSFIIVLAGIMKLINYALSLSGIAAVILSIGMAVDSNILIYERLKEETANGKKTSAAIDVAYDRSRPAIRDGNFSTGLIALLLAMLGTNMFKGFGSMLIITILVTLYINVPLTKILLKEFYKNEK